MKKITGSEKVKVHYTGKLSDGQIFDTSEERGPLEVTLGQGQLIPGFEKGLVGMQVNDKKTIIIPKEEAYGNVQEELFQEIPKQNLPKDITPQVGMGLVSHNPDGSERYLRVTEVLEDGIIVDANHPLAGQDLTFDLEVLEIE